MRPKMSIFTLCFFALAIMINSVLAQPGNPPPPPPGGGQNDQAPVFDPNYQPVTSTYSGIGTVTIGEGDEIGNFSLTTACTTRERFVDGASGSVTADDDSQWIVPMEVNEGAGTIDLYNNCTADGDNPNALDQLNTIVIDEGGEIITATIFADNYFELYVNGTFVGRDNINFIPFNSTVVRFQAAYPMTIAVHMADWETHFGLGMEYDSYNVGDAGFIANFSDGTVTNADWKVLPVYIAPLDDPGCVVEDSFGNPDSSACSTKPECSTSNAAVCRALHYPLPENWTMPDFDDSNWQNATLYTADQVTNQPAYTNYASQFGDAEFIWSPSLKLDNQVLARFTIQAP
jgi:hypothetical protein